MAAVPPPLSPRQVSPKGTDAMGAQHAFIPGLLRCASYPARATGQPSKPSALLERRVKMNPTLNLSSFQASLGRSPFQAAGVGTSANRSKGISAFQVGVGTGGKTATLYDVLEVPRTATENEIKTAYRRLAREHHPDRAPLQEKEASTTKFLQIQSAYSALSDRHSRAQYDLHLSLPSFQSPGHHNRSPQFSSNYCSPRTPYSSGRGRSWETDQCWC